MRPMDKQNIPSVTALCPYDQTRAEENIRNLQTDNTGAAKMRPPCCVDAIVQAAFELFTGYACGY